MTTKHSVFVGSKNPEGFRYVSQADVAAAFSRFDTVRDAFCPSTSNHSYCFVQFDSPQGVARALRAGEIYFCGQRFMISPSTRTSKSWQTSHDASSYSSAQVRPPPAGPSTGVDLTSSAQFSIGAGRSSGGIAPNGVEQAYQHNIKSAPDPAMTERSWRVGAEQKERAGIDEQGQEPPRRKRSRGSSSPGSTSRPSTRRQPSSAQPSARDSSSRRYTSPSLSTRSSSPMPPEPKEKSGAAAGTASSGAEPDVTKGEEMCVDTSEQLEARRYIESCSLMVRNLPAACDSQLLYDFASQGGSLLKLEAHGYCTGDGFLQWSKPAEASTALEILNGRKIFGEPIRLQRI